jgi:hypothetical protein
MKGRRLAVTYSSCKPYLVDPGSPPLAFGEPQEVLHHTFFFFLHMPVSSLKTLNIVTPVTCINLEDFAKLRLPILNVKYVSVEGYFCPSSISPFLLFSVLSYWNLERFLKAGRTWFVQARFVSRSKLDGVNKLILINLQCSLFLALKSSFSTNHFVK